jgi:hypothetical protein
MLCRVGLGLLASVLPGGREMLATSSWNVTEKRWNQHRIGLGSKEVVRLTCALSWEIRRLFWREHARKEDVERNVFVA